MVASLESRDATPRVVLRTYRESDHDQVEYLFRSTQSGLVYESIRSKLWAPATWIVWFVVYSILLMIVPKLLPSMADWVMIGVRLVATFLWAVVGFTFVFIGSDRVEIQNRTDEALANDLKDPEMYYLKYTLEDGKKVRNDNQPSHFWVLTLDNEVCGMIGLSCNSEDVEDQRDVLPVGWKQFCVAFLELFRIPVSAYLKKGKPCTNDYNDKKRIFAHLQLPKTATITRWAVRADLQSCGLSTLLINRAITWAGEHDINRVYAMTNECCMAAEQILTKRHGFSLMRLYKLNFFGEYNKLFAVRVKEWEEKNGEKTRHLFTKKAN